MISGSSCETGGVGSSVNESWSSSSSGGSSASRSQGWRERMSSSRASWYRRLTDIAEDATGSSERSWVRVVRDRDRRHEDSSGRGEGYDVRMEGAVGGATDSSSGKSWSGEVVVEAEGRRRKR